MAKYDINYKIRAKTSLVGPVTQQSGSFKSYPFVGNKFAAILDSNAGTGTSPTLNVKAQTSYDDGSSWVDIPSGAFTQVTTSASLQIKVYDNVGDIIRFEWTIGGSASPTFTFGVFVVGAGD